MKSFISGLLLLASLSASAVEHWETPGDGLYNDISNWTTQVPGSADHVVFDQDLAYTVTLSGTQNRRVRTLTVPRGDLTLDLNGKGYWIDYGTPDGLLIGTEPGESASLTIPGGSLHLDTYLKSGFRIGNGAGTHGTLNLTSRFARLYGSTTDGYIGWGGQGHVYVGGGASFYIPGTVYISSQGKLTIDGDGSAVNPGTYQGRLELSDDAQLNVQNGGHVAISTLDLTSSSVINVSGQSSFLGISSVLTGIVNIFDNGWASAPELRVDPILNISDGGNMQVHDNNVVAGVFNIGAETRVRTYLGRYATGSLDSRYRDGLLSFEPGGELNLNGGLIEGDVIDCSADCNYYGLTNSNSGFNMVSGILSINEFRGELINKGGVVDRAESPPIEQLDYITTVTGDYVQRELAALRIKIDGFAAGVDHDQLIVSDTAFLDGLLEVVLNQAVSVNAGDSFDVVQADTISGQFAAIGNRCINPSLRWDVSYHPDAAGTDVVRITAVTLAAPETCEPDPVIVQADLDPWSDANVVRPAAISSVTVAVMGRSIDSGDPIDFDVTQINPVSLKLGSDEASNISGAPLYDDFDNDGNTDAAFVFQTQETGINCIDFEVSLQGETLAGVPFIAKAPIQTTECSPKHVGMRGVLTVIGDADFYQIPRQWELDNGNYRARPGDNLQLLNNILGSGTNIYIDAWSGNPGSLDDLYTETGGVTVSSGFTEITSELLEDVDLLILLDLPVRGREATFDAEAAAVRAFLDAGGNVLVIAEIQYHFVIMPIWNDFLAKIGTTIRYDLVQRCCGGARFADTVYDTPQTWGVDQVRISQVNNLLGGKPVFGESGFTVAAYEQIGVLDVEVDVDPWSATNTVRPDSNDSIFVAVMGSSLTSGDAQVFDVADVDPTTLKFGAGDAPNISQNPLAGDYDSDGNTDAAFAFQTQDSGIFCDDTEVTLRGETYGGTPFEGVSAIQTTDCDAGGCHP